MMQQRTTDGLKVSFHEQHFFILCCNSLIYSNTDKKFKYQFMGSMAQLGTWDAVVDLGHGSKGTLSVILFVLNPFLVTGRIDYH